LYEKKMEFTPVDVPKPLVEKIDALVKGGAYPSRVEFMERAINDLLGKEDECFVDLECLAGE